MMDAYTVKKILPRLIIAVILIQFSYYLVGIGVDAANILGKGIDSLLLAPIKNQGLGIDFAQSGSDTAAVTVVGIGGAAAWVGIIGGLSAFSGGVGALFLLILPALIAVIGVFFTLIFRQILIVMLAILSPVAFVAWILPGTQRFFKLWLDNLLRALVMYPLIIVLLTSGTILAVIASNIGGSGQEQTVGQIMSVAAIIAPLLLIPATFKMSGAAIGAIGGFMAGVGARVMGNPQNPRSLAAKRGQGIDRGREKLANRRGNWAVGGGVVGRTAVGRAVGRGLRSDKKVLNAHAAQVFKAQEEHKKRGIAESKEAQELILGGHKGYKAQRAEHTKTMNGARALRDRAQRGLLTQEDVAKYGAGQAGRDAALAAAERTMIKTDKDRRKLDMQWGQVSDIAGSAAHKDAAALGLGSSGLASTDTLRTIASAFPGGGTTPDNDVMAGKLGAQVAFGAMEKNPVLKDIDVPTMTIPKGKAAQTVAGAGIDKQKSFSTEAWAYALRDKYVIDGGSDAHLQNATLQGLLDDAKTPQSTKDMITELATAHQGGGSVRVQQVMAGDVNPDGTPIDRQNNDRTFAERYGLDKVAGGLAAYS